VNLKMWRRHIDSHLASLKGFAVPFHHEAGSPWREKATRAGVIFDRLRIAKLVIAAALPVEPRQAMADWCEARCEKILELTIAPL
jgi:hypothetical protein